MRKIDFTKIVASGNDFAVIKNSCQLSVVSCQSLAKRICERKYGVGADGLLVLERSRVADVRMRIFNPDGSEAQMCGNGARATALYKKARKVKIETRAGIIESEVSRDNVKIKLTEPKEVKLNLPIKLGNGTLRVNFINTGVPHAVIFVAGLDKIDVLNLGRQIRYHKKFSPQGTNVDFVEVLNKNSVKLRTYERGVEGETLACGTGTVAAALITDYRLPITDYRKINVHTKSGEILKVYFEKTGQKFSNVWLEGKARIVYKGAYYV